MRIFYKFKLLKFITYCCLLAFGFGANGNVLAKANAVVKSSSPKKAQNSSTKEVSGVTCKIRKKSETNKGAGVNKKPKNSVNSNYENKKNLKHVAPVKDGSAKNNFNTNASVASNALEAILIDGRTNDVIYEKNADYPAPMASTTKVMTALLACEYISKMAKLKNSDVSTFLDSLYPVHAEAVNQRYLEGTSLLGLKDGDLISMRGLLYGLMFLSGNDAANEIAIRVSGSIVEFVKLMNERCKALGFKNTSYSSPSGLGPEDVVYIKNLDNKTTARELALLMSYVFKNSKTMRQILKTPSINSEQLSKMWKRKNIDKKDGRLELYSQHKFLHRGSKHFYEYSCGGKTGFTNKAGRCLVSVAKKDDLPLIAVVLNCHEHWGSVRNMFDYGFSQYKDFILPQDSDNTRNALENLSLRWCGEEDKYFKVKVKKPCKISAQNSILNNYKVDYKIVASPFYFGKLKEGDTVGKIEYYLKGRLVAKSSLVSAEDVSDGEN